VIDQAIEISGIPLSVDASIGYAVSPADGTDVDELLQHADIAMYVAKAHHVGVMRYDPSQDNYDAANLTLITDLRYAIGADQLLLHYQPKAVLADGTIEAVEALVRWRHPTLGLLYPDRFIGLAEQSDLIGDLTDWVLNTALRETQELGPEWSDLIVAVNVSARSLAGSNFADNIAGVLQRLGCRPERLIVEITETALLTDPPHAALVLGQLAALGVRSSLDDFGQGQTSLGLLSSLPVSELKIDKSFVGDMLSVRAHAAIVKSIVDLGHNLSLRVVAEGVETEDVLARLKTTGCDVVQGYLLARPMPIDQLAGWLAGTTPALATTSG
jgi:predicted signal transduction protein with EAL and GGDEF domain